MMVQQMGFSKLGQVAWVSGGGPSFVGASAGQAPECSAHTQDMMDEEIKELVERSYRYLFCYDWSSYQHCSCIGVVLSVAGLCFQQLIAKH